MSSASGMRLTHRFNAFFAQATVGGIVLLVATVAALLWANVPSDDSYEAVWHDTTVLGESLRHWIAEGLMVIFFFAIGLEIKRELVVGKLASPRRAALPIVAALGGAILPALIFAAINRGGDGAHGWGIPMAPDPAFALGLLALLGGRIPAAPGVFLAALAIVDDVVAVQVIAVTHSDELAWVRLAVAAVLLVVLLLANRAGVRSPLPYVLVGIGLWLAVLDSGLHPTIVGVALALTMPARGATSHAPSLVDVVVHRIQPWVAFAIVPLFALANAGIALSREVLGNAAAPVALGVALGLVVGKPIGIVGASFGAFRLGIATLPGAVRWVQVVGVVFLVGICFTTAMFIADLAYGSGASPDEAKLGILGGSLAAAMVGWALLSHGCAQPLQANRRA